MSSRHDKPHLAKHTIACAFSQAIKDWVQMPDLACVYWLCGGFFEQLFFAVDQRIYVVRGKLKTVAMGNGIGRTCFHAIAAKNAPAVIDVVDAGVALTRGNSLTVGIFRRFDVDAIRRASRRAQETPDALFQPALIAMQNMHAAIARLEIHGFVRDSSPSPFSGTYCEM